MFWSSRPAIAALMLATASAACGGATSATATSEPAEPIAATPVGGPEQSPPADPAPPRQVEADLSLAATGAPLPPAAKLRSALDDAMSAGKAAKGGKNADYIPALDKVDSKLFGVAIVTSGGEIMERGDTKQRFSIQSISKAFTLALVMEEMGAKAVEEKIGVGATGMPFNSIIAIETVNGEKDARPDNPLVNAGAIATVSWVPAKSKEQRWERIIGIMSDFAGRRLDVDKEVYRSESETNTRNRSISWLLAAYESLGSDPMEALDLYTRQCSISVSAHDLAVMGATLSNGGVNPVTGKRVVSADTARRVLAVMMTAGLYENSGQWAVQVGVPAKSGVGGGIVAVVPGALSVGTFAPPLDAAGNSVRGQKAIGVLVDKLGISVFASRPKRRETAATQ